MANLISRKTNEGIKHMAPVGAAVVGFATFVAFQGMYDFWPVLVLGGAAAGAALFAGAAMVGYHLHETRCSDCNANLTRFVDSPGDDSLIHCPSCGVKFDYSRTD